MSGRRSSAWRAWQARRSRGRKQEDDGAPFACVLCRRPWEEAPDPVVTLCRHHFCEACALAHNEKLSPSALCAARRRRAFNVAHDVLRKLKRTRAGKADALVALHLFC